MQASFQLKSVFQKSSSLTPLLCPLLGLWLIPEVLGEWLPLPYLPHLQKVWKATVTWRDTVKPILRCILVMNHSIFHKNNGVLFPFWWLFPLWLSFSFVSPCWCKIGTHLLCIFFFYFSLVDPHLLICSLYIAHNGNEFFFNVWHIYF